MKVDKYTKTMTVATKDGCTGSIDGKTFMYEDGSEDMGVQKTYEMTRTTINDGTVILKDKKV